MDDLATRIREKIKAAVALVEARVAEVKREETEIRGEIEKHGLALEKMKKKRQRLARRARKNAEAKAQLKKIEADQRSIELAAEDAHFALEDCQRNLSELEVEREDAQRRAAWEMIGELIPEGQEQAREISELIVLFVARVSAHAETLDWLKRLAHNSGRERSFATADLRHVWRCMAEGLRPVDPYGWGTFPQYRGKSYSDIFGQMVQGATRDEPADPNAMPPANGEDSDGDIMVDPEGETGAEA